MLVLTAPSNRPRHSEAPVTIRGPRLLDTGVCRLGNPAPDSGPSAPGELLKIASKRRELFAALSLVHDTYVRAGFIRPNRYGLRVTPYHTLPSTDVVVAVRKGAVVSTMTIIADSELGLPLEEIYPDEVEWRRCLGLRIAEVGCLANLHEEMDTSLPVLLKLMSLTAQLSTYRGIDELLIAVHPRHAKFYERFIAFERIGEEKTYEAVSGNPAVLLALDLNGLRQRNQKAYKRLYGKTIPEHVLQRRPLSHGLLAELREMAAICEAEAERELEPAA